VRDGWLCPERVFDGESVRTGVSLRVEQGCVVEVAEDRAQGRAVKGCLSLGFVDLQVNGGGGVLLNTDPTVHGMTAIAAAHRQFGTVAIMPTVITDAPEVLDAAADAAINACGQAGIMGLHIEGPHIALAKRGTHAAEHIRPLDTRTMDVVHRLRHAGVPVMITVAPEAVTPEQISQLAALGAVVSLGHTNASVDQMIAAIGAGARCGTHLYNAMSPMQGHVDDAMIGLALRATKPDCAFLVSDAMATVGGPSEFDLYGQTIRVEGGRLINSDGNLAGAHITQAQGIQRLVNHVGVPLEQALRMAIRVPSLVMGLPTLATLEGRRIEDLIVIGDDVSVNADLRGL